MKPLKNKKIKNLIIILIVTVILSGFMPNYVHAATHTENGGKLLEPIVDFVTFLCDNVMQWLQGTFTSTKPLEEKSEEYEYTFRYSPAIIFSGTVQAFDINFITPSEDRRHDFNATVRGLKEKFWDIMEDDIDSNYAKKYQEKTEDYNNKLSTLSSNSEYQKFTFEVDTANYSYTDYLFYRVEDDIVYIECLGKFTRSAMGAATILVPWTYSKTYNLNNSSDAEELGQIGKYESTAAKLQGTIATWYNALRRIALVGLLSVLVYVGIRIVLTSSSQDKAKYKGMLKDWLVALCLLFTLHYIMNATIIIVNKISDVFSPGDTDPLLNDLRTKIKEGSLGTVIAQVIMYVTIVILTIKFTIQYIMRVIYMAFYTLIAPLITLTYPLDKIKDGQAQAFNMWIREYIFTALTQVIHLIIYTTLVSSALALVDEYALFAIIVMAFIKKAEDMIKKMFGFEKAETVSALGAAATGGIVMNAINQLKGIGGKKGKSGGGSSGSGESSGGNVRTATNNPLAGIKPAGGSASTTGVIGTTGSSGGSSPRTTGNLQKSTEASSKPKRSIKGGVGSLIGKYYKPVGGTALGLLTGGAGAMIGFAAGVAQGDLGAAFGGAVAGGAAGMNLGKGAVNLPGNVKDKVKTGWSNVKDTYREGAYGEEEKDAERIRDK